MSQAKLLELVNALEQELDNSEEVDQAIKEKISQDLETLKSAAPDELNEEDSPLLEAVVHLEESHPKAVTIINDIAQAVLLICIEITITDTNAYNRCTCERCARANIGSSC